MSISAVYKLHAIDINTDDTPGPRVIGSLDSGGLQTEMEIERQLTAGSIYPQTVRRKLRHVMVDVTTRDIKNVLTVLGIAGQCIRTATQPGITLYYAQYNCGEPVAGAAHLSYTITNGVIYPETLTANHDDDATISFRILALQDGATSPVVKQSAVALPSFASGSPTDRWGMYTATINSVACDHKRRININFGAQANTEGSDNDDFNSWGDISSVSPICTISGVNPQWMSDDDATPAGLGIPIEGANVVHAATKINFKKNGVAIGVAEHITMTMEGAAHFTQPVAGDARQLATSELQISPIYNGTQAPIVLGIDVLIT